MSITKASIGAHLVGLPPHAARGLHNLFNHLFDEIERLRGVTQEPAAEVTGDVLPPVVPPAATETDSVGDGATANPDTTDASADVPPAAGNADPLPATPALTNADADAAPAVPTSATPDTSVLPQNTDEAGAPADVPPAA